MTVPVFTEKSLRQERQRYGWGLREARIWMFSELHAVQRIPPGQRASTNHCSAVWLSGNFWKNSMREMP